MKIRFEDTPELLIAGVSHYGTLKGEGWESTNSIGHTWSRFTQFIDANPDIYNTSARDKNRDFEIHLWQENHWLDTKEFQVFVGYQISADKIGEIPPYMDIKVLPATTYAVLALEGEEITTWEQTLDRKLPKDKYPRRKFASGTEYVVQIYTKEFKLDSIESSTLQVLIPLDPVVQHITAS
ncbi:MAG: GyrI-like domain-containing protein [Candidatus Kariarchaeaceae archaeon]|jgi:predicted transcriptional regulator YdeE